MTTATVEKGLLSVKAIRVLVDKMMNDGVMQAFPTVSEKYNNEAIAEIIIDEEGNVFILPENSNEVILPQFAKLA